MKHIEPEEGWFKEQLEKFKIYLGTAQRYMINRELEDWEYEAISKTKIIEKYDYLAEKCKTTSQ